tara:strand:+ start:369 stop:557 length:189 start_codon:yes stop_codon:yes gene_type:complete
MKKHQDKGLKMNRKDAINKIGGYSRYAALTALGTYIILNPQKAQAQSADGGGGGFPDPGENF